MKLTILSLQKKEEHNIAWIEINTPDGNVIIQPEHAPTTFILSAEKECIYCLKTGKHETLIIKKTTILQVSRKEVFLML